MFLGQMLNDKKFIVKIDEWRGSVASSISDIYDGLPNGMPTKLKRYIFSISHYVEKIAKLDGDAFIEADQYQQAVSHIFQRAKELELALLSVEVNADAVKLFHNLINRVRRHPMYASESPRNSNDEERMFLLKKNLVGMEDSARTRKLEANVKHIEIENNRNRQILWACKRQMEDLQKNLDSYGDRLNEVLDGARKQTLNIIEDLEKKREEINGLVGIVSGTAVAGNFAQSADAEKFWANVTRAGSVLLMIIVACIIGYSLYETGKPHFDWQTALFRLIFSLALSVPAAYLARESTKHRHQQYVYLRTSLDLQSINPYLASLPEEDQHKLKTEVANRIFGGKDSAQIQSDSYPINVHEIIMALVSKIEIQKINPIKNTEEVGKKPEHAR